MTEEPVIDRPRGVGFIPLSGSLLITFRELRSTHVAIGLFAVTTLAWGMLAFAMNLEVVEGSVAALRIFGMDMTPSGGHRDPETGDWIRSALTLDQFAVSIQSFIAGAAYLLGTFLGLFAAVPVAAGTFESGRIELMLSKPVSRTRLLAGHVLGVWIMVLALATYLVGALWLVFWIKTGIRTDGFLTAIPIITVMFAVMYGAALAMLTAGAAAPLTLILTYGLIFAAVILATKDQVLGQLSPTGRTMFMTLYHVLPNFIEVIPIMAKLVGRQTVESWYPFWSSVSFGVVCYGFAAWRFHRRDF